MARRASAEIRLGEESFTVETPTLGELGKAMPLFAAYFEICMQGGATPLAAGAVEAGAAIVAAFLKREAAEVLAMPIDFAQLSQAIFACGRVAGLEGTPVGEALAVLAGAKTPATLGTSPPSTPPSPPAAATDTPTSTG